MSTHYTRSPSATQFRPLVLVMRAAGQQVTGPMATQQQQMKTKFLTRAEP